MKSDNILKLVKTYTSHDMITAHTDLPEFPKLRIQLLYTFLTHGALDTDEEEDEHDLYALVISLMQMALDTHEMVDGNNEPTNERKMRSNQLKVLAGDYFSSRFYQLLAKRGHIEFIQLISHAICELNRIKMNFYLNLQNKRMTSEDFIDQSARIKMQLFLPFTELMKGSFSEKWTELLHSISHCEVIAEQIELSDSKVNDKETWGFWYRQRHDNAAELKPTLLAMLERELALVNKQIKLLDSEQMIQELSRIGELFSKYLEVPYARQEI